MSELLLLPLLLAAPLESAEAASESQRPYQLIVCLRIDDDPLLTERFVNGVSREVRDQLRNFFGPLADVSVKTAEHWLIDDYQGEDVDLPFLDAEIMEARNLLEQAFIFRVSFDRANYLIRWRQMDGQTGQIGTVRSRQTPDRQWVAKTICLAVRDDFAVRATITPGDGPGGIEVDFVGQQYEDHLRRITGDRMFMRLNWVSKGRNGSLRKTVPQTLVLWQRVEDRYAAHVVSTYANPWSRNAGVAYEAVRIHTQPGRLRLKLIDQERSTPVTNRTVAVNDSGFDKLQNSDILPRANRYGVTLSPHVLQDVAYVRIDQGGGGVVKIPLPITNDICDHTLPIAADRHLLAKNDYERNLRFLTQDLQTLSTIQSAAVSSANDLNGRKRYEEALKHLDQVVRLTGTQLDNADITHSDLKAQAESLQIKDLKLLGSVTAGLAQLRDRHGELSELRTSIVEVIERRDAQARSNVSIKLGEQAERDADYEEALTRYALALGEQPEQPALQKKLDDMREQWRIKGPQHEAARTFVYERWANAEVTELAELLPEAEAALDALVSVDDNLTPRKILNVNGAHLAALTDLVARLAERTSDEDRKETEKYVALTEQLASFQEAVAQSISDHVSEPETTVDPDDKPTSTVTEPAKPAAKPTGESASEPKKDRPADGSSLLDLNEEEESPCGDNRSFDRRDEG